MSDDPRLSALIKQGSDGEIVLVGYPFEHASLRMRRKGGQENGPCCLRRFYGKIGPLVNSQYEIDISDIKITDYGNIVGDPKNYKLLQTSLKGVVDDFLKNNQIPITLGGSRETTVASTISFLQKYPKAKFIYFCGYPSVSRPYDNDKLTSNSLFQVLPEIIRQQSILIGTHEKYWPTSKIQIKRIDINQIHQAPFPQMSANVYEPRTQLGNIIKNLLSTETSTQIYVSFSMQVIQHFMGTFYKVYEGIEQEEVFETLLLLGKDKRVKCLDFTQFNPANQDYNSSLTILNMIYYFLLGYKLRTLSNDIL